MAKGAWDPFRSILLSVKHANELNKEPKNEYIVKIKIKIYIKSGSIEIIINNQWKEAKYKLFRV